ncbi:hypothetical protein [Methylorubrum aminovorans]
MPLTAAGPVMTVRVMCVTVRVTLMVAASVALAVLMRRVTAHPDLPDIGARDRRRRATRIAAWPPPIRQGLNSTRVD